MVLEMRARSWTCYARPVSNGRRTCFHVNTAADSYCFYRDTLCCTKCGTPKHASDLRQAAGDPR